VSENYRIEFSTVEFRFAPVLRAFFFSTLKETTIDKNASLVSYNMISRSGYVSGCSMEMDFHLVS
jgi:hypothetical protein